MSAEPTRYDHHVQEYDAGFGPGYESTMIEAPGGAYVLHADYLRDVAALRERLAMEEDASATLRAEEKYLREQVAALTEERERVRLLFCATTRTIDYDRWVASIGERNALEAERDKLAAALREYLGPARDLTNAHCHVGISSAEECFRCGRELRLRALLPHETPDGGMGAES